MPETPRRATRRTTTPPPPAHNYERINFDREFKKGPKAYDKLVGNWWRERSEDGPHALAYRTIADFCHRLNLPEAPTIVDYACGHGSLMLRLFRKFPKARIIGIDGSEVNIGIAQERLRKLNRNAMDRVEFIKTKLPDFSLPTKVADLSIFMFPNIVANDDDQPYYDKHGYKHPADSVVGTTLAKLREPDPEDETLGDDQDPELLFDEIMTNRVVARNIRSLTRKGGLCVRVEYANSIREGLTELVQDRTGFEEGSLTRKYGGKKSERFFEYLFGDYHRSKVIEDVYHQTRDDDDKVGGYMMGVLKAI